MRVRQSACGAGTAVPSGRDPEDLGIRVQDAFDELGRLSFAEHSLESLLQRVTALAAHVLPGEPVTSVTIVERGRPSTVASSGELALDLDETQYRLGSGPCLDAATSGRRRELADTRATTDWVEFAAYAVVPVSNMYLYETAVEKAAHLETALDSRAVIDQAKGILMERFTLTADQAFQVLTRVSMESNTKVRDVAGRFAQTGDLPSG